MWSGEEIRRFLQLLPVGFGFHPSDEQLVSHYLLSKIQGRNSQLKMEALESQMRMGMEMEMEIIPEVDLCRCEPPELAALLKHPVFSALQSSSSDPEWYFFCTPQKKYPNGRRVQRATTQGFWKPTGPDRKIPCRTTGIDIGTKKTLVFHTGRGPSAPRTPWIIHEYHSSIPYLSQKKNNSYVLCRLKKDVGPGCPLETNFDRVSPPPANLTSFQTPSTITKEVGSSSTTSPGIHQTGDRPTTETVGSTNFAAPYTKDDDKHDDITSDVRNKGKDRIIPEETDVLCDDDSKEEAVGSDFPAETNINRMSPEPPSVEDPSLTTMEVDKSSVGVGTHQAAALADNMSLADSDMIDQQNCIDWDAINHNDDGMISQKTDVLCRVKEDAGSDFRVETNLNGMPTILPLIQAPVLTSMEIDPNTSTGDGVHQTAGQADNINLGANDLIFQQNDFDWNAVNYFEDDVMIPQSQESDLAAKYYAFDLGYGHIHDFVYPWKEEVGLCNGQHEIFGCYKQSGW